MVGRIFGKFLGDRKKAQVPADVTAIFKGMLENEAATFQMQANARAANEPCVLLTPSVPVSGQEVSGWFGGAPHLPDDTPWPEIDGEPLRFACQINLSALPINIWSSLGPRDGWLAVFFHPETCSPKVLFFRGALKERKGPGQTDAVWFWPRSYMDKKPLQEHLPRWPFTITGHVGALPPPSGWRAGKAPGFPDPRDTETRDLSDPAFHPFNEATLVALVDALAEYFDLKARRIGSFLETKKIRDNDRVELLGLKEEVGESLEIFSGIRGELLPFCETFEYAPVNRLVSLIARLPTFELCYLKDDENGHAVVNYRRLKLSDKPNPMDGRWWYNSYADLLYRHAVYAYTRDPGALPPPLRRRMEAIWQFEALHERGAMGHAPLGHVYTPHGPTTTNAVLLELATSNMMGWAWGDMYSIVLFIERAALKRGDFGNITFEITN